MCQELITLFSNYCNKKEPNANYLKFLSKCCDTLGYDVETHGGAQAHQYLAALRRRLKDPVDYIKVICCAYDAGLETNQSAKDKEYEDFFREALSCARDQLNRLSDVDLANTFTDHYDWYTKVIKQSLATGDFPEADKESVTEIFICFEHKEQESLVYLLADSLSGDLKDSENVPCNADEIKERIQKIVVDFMYRGLQIIYLISTWKDLYESQIDFHKYNIPVFGSSRLQTKFVVFFHAEERFLGSHHSPTEPRDFILLESLEGPLPSEETFCVISANNNLHTQEKWKHFLFTRPFWSWHYPDSSGRFVSQDDIRNMLPNRNEWITQYEDKYSELGSAERLIISYIEKEHYEKIKKKVLNFLNPKSRCGLIRSNRE